MQEKRIEFYRVEKSIQSKLIGSVENSNMIAALLNIPLLSVMINQS